MLQTVQELLALKGEKGVPRLCKYQREERNPQRQQHAVLAWWVLRIAHTHNQTDNSHAVIKANFPKSSRGEAVLRTLPESSSRALTRFD